MMMIMQWRLRERERERESEVRSVRWVGPSRGVCFVLNIKEAEGHPSHSSSVLEGMDPTSDIPDPYHCPTLWPLVFVPILPLTLLTVPNPTLPYSTTTSPDSIFNFYPLLSTVSNHDHDGCSISLSLSLSLSFFFFFFPFSLCFYDAIKTQNDYNKLIFSTHFPSCSPNHDSIIVPYSKLNVYIGLQDTWQPNKSENTLDERIIFP